MKIKDIKYSDVWAIIVILYITLLFILAEGDILYLLGYMFLSLIILILLSYKNKIFTRIKSDYIRFKLRGDKVIDIYHAVEGEKLEGNALEELTFTEGEEKENFFSRLGLYGPIMPFFESIAEFDIDKGPPKGIEKESELKRNIQRELVISGVESKGKLRYNVRHLITYVVMNPYKCQVKQGNQFFLSLERLVKGSFLAIYSSSTDDEIVNREENGPLNLKLQGLLDPKSELNKTLLKEMGVHLGVISEPDPEAADKETQDALQLKKVAELKKEAKLIEGDGEAGYIQKVGEAKIAIEKGMAAAPILGAKEAMEGMTEEERIHMVNMQKWRSLPNLKVLVEDGRKTITSINTEE